MPDLNYEKAAYKNGHTHIIGIDEAGRGPLAGPVSAAAVILPKNFSHQLLDDSKKLSEKKRELIYDDLIHHPLVFWGHSFAEPNEIDEVNVLRATHAAMARAVDSLITKIEPPIDASIYCLIDGLSVPHFPYASEGIIKGDGKSLSIAAASIIAKVERDRKMLEYAKKFPQYGFEAHKGYGTKAHMAALTKHGPTKIHRQSFAPVAQLTLPLNE